MPFKEHYQCIPPQMYDDVRAHIQEMLDIGTIRKSHSPWASAVVLVWKKDGVLRFCIDLRKLINQTVKDTYSLPHIDKLLTACRALSGSPHLTLSQDTGRSRWMRRVDHQLHSQWGHWASMSVKGCLLGSPMPLLPSKH